nr:MAG TPA: hypothetical protein [Bacteriophage sp.]
MRLSYSYYPWLYSVLKLPVALPSLSNSIKIISGLPGTSLLIAFHAFLLRASI